MVGEFNIWDTSRHTLPVDDRSLECVTALRLDSKDTVMVTGNSLGYIQASIMSICYALRYSLTDCFDVTT